MRSLPDFSASRSIFGVPTLCPSCCRLRRPISSQRALTFRSLCCSGADMTSNQNTSEIKRMIEMGNSIVPAGRVEALWEGSGLYCAQGILTRRWHLSQDLEEVPVWTCMTLGKSLRPGDSRLPKVNIWSMGPHDAPLDPELFTREHALLTPEWVGWLVLGGSFIPYSPVLWLYSGVFGYR